MIQQVPGRFSFLEDLGTKLGQRLQNQDAWNQQQDQEALQRVKMLSDYAAAGLLPPDVLSAQQTSDVSRFGIDPQSVITQNTQARSANERAIAHQGLQEQIAQEQLRSQSELRQAQEEERRAKAWQLTHPQPKPGKQSTQAELIQRIDQYVSGAGVLGAKKLVDDDPDFSGYTDAAKAAYINAARARLAKANASGENRNFQRENSLADDYRTATKTFAQVGNFYQTGMGAVDKAMIGNPAAQQRLIFSWMKLLDPNSVVRPSEYASVEKAQGVPERVRNLYNSTLKGTILSPEAVQRFANEFEATADDWRVQLSPYTQQYTQRAKRAGVDPSAIVLDYLPRRQVSPSTNIPRHPNNPYGGVK